MNVQRIALLGGTDANRSAKRLVLEASGLNQVVYDSDGHLLLPQDFLDVNFDVAIIEQRLGNQSAFEYIKALHSLASIRREEVGRLLVGSQFQETQLRIFAIESGAVDCVFVSEGFEQLVSKVRACADKNVDFAIRELLPELGQLQINQEGFQSAAVALDTLSKSESKVVRAFCQLKNIQEIAAEVGVSEVKVNATLLKVQKLLMLDTRSQLLLRMYRLGALAL